MRFQEQNGLPPNIILKNELDSLRGAEWRVVESRVLVGFFLFCLPTSAHKCGGEERVE